jgi:hypothetical protein
MTDDEAEKKIFGYVAKKGNRKKRKLRYIRAKNAYRQAFPNGDIETDLFTLPSGQYLASQLIRLGVQFTAVN